MERSQDLLDAYLRYVEKTNQGTAQLGEVLSSFPEVSAFGTAPEEWWTGRDALLREDVLERKAREGLGVQYIPDQHPGAWVEGDFGWLTDNPILRLPNGHEQRFRLTTIFHREGGEWKIVHQHYSIGVPNESVEAFASYAQTSTSQPLSPS